VSPAPPARPDVVLILTDQERAAPPYEDEALRAWRAQALPARRWFDEHGVSFTRHYTGSLACVPSRPTLFTGHHPDVHGVTQTDGLGKDADDSAMRWLPPGSVPTLGNWFRAAGYDTHYEGKWHISHADLHDPVTGAVVATNDDDGVVDPAAVQAYLDADPLEPFGFSGWVGPEPHGGSWANSGYRRDPMYAARVVAWLADRYRRRAAGDDDAQRPFLLVASFVNPHDIVLFPGWMRSSPLADDTYGTPPVPPPPTADEDLTTKPAAQAAYRAAYPTGYAPIADGVYAHHGEEYRRLYHRLHADVDGPIDAVRRAVVAGSADAVLVLTADHGELLGAHGGLHQKWFNLYDEATRVPFTIVRVGGRPTTARTVAAPTSHVDVVPTLLAAAGIDPADHVEQLSRGFSELHPLPGHDLMPVVDGAAPDADRTVYLMTRDNILEGDTGASAVARAFGRRDDAPPEMRIHVPEDVASNFEAIVTRHAGRLWKLVRTHDDAATWTEPHVRHLTASGPAGRRWRSEPLPDEWELYDLTGDPVEADNRWGDPALADVRGVLVARLDAERARCCPPRHTPWPYRPRLQRPA
jgi:arylsulfatase A-like enzyme